MFNEQYKLTKTKKNLHTQILMSNKLDGVGHIDNRLSTDKFHNFVKKKKLPLFKVIFSSSCRQHDLTPF